jgi:hypothetical protein
LVQGFVGVISLSVEARHGRPGSLGGRLLSLGCGSILTLTRRCGWLERNIEFEGRDGVRLVAVAVRLEAVGGEADGDAGVAAVNDADAIARGPVEIAVVQAQRGVEHGSQTGARTSRRAALVHDPAGFSVRCKPTVAAVNYLHKRQPEDTETAA